VQLTLLESTEARTEEDINVVFVPYRAALDTLNAVKRLHAPNPQNLTTQQLPSNEENPSLKER